MYFSWGIMNSGSLGTDSMEILRSMNFSFELFFVLITTLLGLSFESC
jgi:hypothetical protein